MQTGERRREKVEDARAAERLGWPYCKWKYHMDLHIYMIIPFTPVRLHTFNLYVYVYDLLQPVTINKCNKEYEYKSMFLYGVHLCMNIYETSSGK